MRASYLWESLDQLAIDCFVAVQLLDAEDPYEQSAAALTPSVADPGNDIGPRDLQC